MGILIILLFGVHAEASVVLKQVQVSKGDQVDFLFDQNLSENQVSLEYLRDIIQINLKDTSVYPAKILSVDGPSLTKVFAYQYTPAFVRARLTMKQDAKEYQARTKYSINGRMLTVKIETPVPPPAPVVTPKAETKLNASEKKLLKKVMKETAKPKVNLMDPMKLSLGFSALFGGILIVFLGFRRFGKINVSKILTKKPGKFASFFNRIQIGRGQKRPIEVVASHYLGPKKSIAVIKVMNRTMVIGVTDEAINLISDMSESEVEESPDETLSFGALLEEKKELPKPIRSQSSSMSDVRERIKRKLEASRTV